MGVGSGWAQQSLEEGVEKQQTEQSCHRVRVEQGRVFQWCRGFQIHSGVDRKGLQGPMVIQYVQYVLECQVDVSSCQGKGGKEERKQVG